MRSSYALGPWPFDGRVDSTQGSLIFYTDGIPAAAIAFEDFSIPAEFHEEIVLNVGFNDEIVNVTSIYTVDHLRRKGTMTGLLDKLRANGVTPVFQIQKNKEYDNTFTAFLQSYIERERSFRDGENSIITLSTKTKTVYMLRGDEILDEDGDPIDPWKSLLCSMR